MDFLTTVYDKEVLEGTTAIFRPTILRTRALGIVTKDPPNTINPNIHIQIYIYL
jgi:hypothetical protein